MLLHVDIVQMSQENGQTGQEVTAMGCLLLRYYFVLYVFFKQRTIFHMVAALQRYDG